MPGPRVIDGFAIGASGQGDVVRVLVTALDFERGHAHLDQLRHLFQGVQIAGRKKVTGVVEWPQPAVDPHLIWQTASLSALAAVSAAASPGFRREALSGVGDAKRSMDEYLGL